MAPEYEQEQEIDLGNLLDAAIRCFSKMKFWVILILLLCSGTMIYRAYANYTVTYSSRSYFIVSMDEAENIYLAEDKNNQMMSTFIDLMQGELMQEIIQDVLETDYVPASVSLKPVEHTNLMEMTTIAASPQDAYDVAVCILNNYHRATHTAMSDVKLSVLDMPRLAQQPDREPDYVRIGLKGAIIGGAISLVLIGIMAFFRGTVLTPAQITRQLHLKNLAEIPKIRYSGKKKSRITDLILSNKACSYAIHRAFYSVRLNIERQHSKDNSQVFMVTSALADEGKTLTAINTALALAAKDKKVILVDLDLRNPSIGKILDLPVVSHNVPQYLDGACGWEGGTFPVADTHLDVFCGGSHSDNATELLSGPRLETMLQEMKEQYDYIILDLPPLYLMEDALIAADVSDCAIVVIRQDYVPVKQLLDVLDDFTKKIPAVLGTVLNAVTPTVFSSEESKYSYGYGYGYSYSYGRKYGYGSKYSYGSYGKSPRKSRHDKD